MLKGGRPLNVPKQMCLNKIRCLVKMCLNRMCLNKVLWCSLVEPTPVYPGGRRGNNSRPHAKIATGFAWQRVAAREKPWQFLTSRDQA